MAFEQLGQGGWTALILAARWGRTDCVQLLLDAGADKNATDNVRGRSFLDCYRVYIHVLQPALHLIDDYVCICGIHFNAMFERSGLVFIMRFAQSCLPLLAAYLQFYQRCIIRQCNFLIFHVCMQSGRSALDIADHEGNTDVFRLIEVRTQTRRHLT